MDRVNIKHGTALSSLTIGKTCNEKRNHQIQKPKFNDSIQYKSTD